MGVEGVIKEQLMSGSKMAKDIVKACEDKGLSRSNAFYWLGKLRKAGVIKKIGEKYELVKIEEATAGEVDLFLKGLSSKYEDVRREAARDFEALCREKKVAHHDRVWSFTKEGLEDRYGGEGRVLAIEVLYLISRNPLTAKDRPVQKRLQAFQEPLVKAVLSEDLDPQYRRIGAFTLYDILPKRARFKLTLELLEKLMRETSDYRSFKSVGFVLWTRVLNEYLEQRKMELRKWIYSLLEDESVIVRDIASSLLSELRFRER
jgi:hypothetical protein